MGTSNTCWGIEIGAAAIKALKVQAAAGSGEKGGGEGVRVLEYATIPHPKVLSTPGVDAADSLRVSLGTLVSQFDLSGARIAVSVPGHAAFARFAKLPPVEPKKVPDIVRFEAMQQIPFPLEEVEWDYQTFVSPDTPDVEVGIFAITKERIQERLGQLADVGIVPDVVTLSPIAAYNALAYDLDFPEQTPGTIIVDVGTVATDLVIAEAGRVWVRTFPIGGHQFTEALVQAFQLSYAKAERLKAEAEDSKHARQVFQAMRPVFTDLAQDIQRSIGYYNSLHKDAKLVRVIGMGSTFRLPGLRKYLKQQLGIEVYRIEEFKRLDLGAIRDPARVSELNEAALSMMTAYGLALQGLDLHRIAANLMPVSMVRDAAWKRKVPWFAAAAGLSVAAGAAFFVRPVMDYLAVKGALEPPIIKQVVSEATRLKNEAAQAEVTGNAQADYRAANVAALLEGREVYAHLVNDLGEIFRTADARAQTWKTEVAQRRGPGGDPVVVAPGPAFKLQRFATNYVPPRSGGTDAFGRGGGMAEQPASDKPMITVDLEITTTQPDATRFMLETVEPWLKANATRPGVPYTIVVGDTPWRLEGKKKVGTEPAPSGPEGGERMAIGAPSEGRATGRRPRGGGISEGGGDAGGVMERTPGGDAGGAPGAGDLARLAPLATLKPPDPVGAEVSTLRVRWQAVLNPPAPKEGGR